MDSSTDKLPLGAPAQEKSSKLLTWANLEIFLNTVNHSLIALTTFYLTWYCIKAGVTSYISMHAILSTLGYQILMAEGIMVLYKHNTYTFFVPNREKRTRIHWILLALGSVLGIVGSVWEYVGRDIRGARHFANRHAIWGKIRLKAMKVFGLITNIF